MLQEDNLPVIPFLGLFGIKKNNNNFAILEKNPEFITFWNVTVYILFSLLMVIASAFALRFLETFYSEASKLNLNPFSINVAYAKESALAGQVVSISEKNLTLQPNTEYALKVSIKNIGAQTWTQDKIFFNAKKTAQVFRTKNWFDKYTVVLMNENKVATGQTANFSFKILTPQTPGTYTPGFLLENYLGTDVLGGSVSLTVNVVNKLPQTNSTTANTNTTPTNTTPTASNNDFEAFKMLQSPKDKVTLSTNGTAKISFGIKNNGKKTWTKENTFFNAKSSAQPFKHSSWIDQYTTTSMKPDTVKPGELAFFDLTIQAPSKAGDYNLGFVLEDIKGKDFVNGIFEVLAVVAQGQILPPQDNTNTNTNTNTDPNNQVIDNGIYKVRISMEQPMLRVGLYSSDDYFFITSNSSYTIIDSTQRNLASLSAGQISKVRFDKTNNTYSIESPVLTTVSTNYLRFKPDLASGIMEITNRSDIPSWNKSLNYNKFRGLLEVRNSIATGKTWMINELPLEEYLKGMKETSNTSPMEYLKTMSVAARSYATYHYLGGRKHKAENFHVDATYDQVYKGYTSEITMPNLVSAVEQTRGIFATYNRTPIVAAYFSRSDGRTRSSYEVWGLNYPYLTSVPTTHTLGMPLNGHGVGIDATDALYQAKEDGKTFDKILKYFYTGIELERLYN